MTPALLSALTAPLGALLLAQATPATAPPAPPPERAAEARRLSPEDEEVIRNLELLEKLELLERLELFDAAGDDDPAERAGDGAGPRR